VRLAGLRLLYVLHMCLLVCCWFVCAFPLSTCAIIMPRTLLLCDFTLTAASMLWVL